jgi:O-antigen/teichoic acid export membrane protein
LYLFFLPLLLLLFFQGLLPWKVAGWFFALLVSEHINQELSRLLIAVSEQLTVSVMLFLRSGVWALIVTAWMYYQPADRTIFAVLSAWTLGGALALALGIYRLRTMGLGGWRKAVDWKWIIAGLKISIPLVIATLALRGLSTLDRYWFESIAGLQYLGVYVLFAGVSGALLSFLDAGVFAFVYPGLIQSHQNNDTAAFRAGLRRLTLQTVGLSVGFSVCALILIQPILHWLGKPVYLEQSYLFPWVLTAVVLSALSMIPHYALYAQGIDRPLIRSHICGFLFFCIVTWLLSGHLAQLAVPIAVCTAQLLILFWKTWQFYQCTPLALRTLKR